MRLAFLLVAMSVSATYAATFVPNKAVGDTHDCAHYYPENSREVSEYGDVTVRYDVDATGTILNVATKVSSGSTRLDDAVVACIRDRWKDTPATLDGKPVASPNQ